MCVLRGGGGTGRGGGMLLNCIEVLTVRKPHVHSFQWAPQRLRCHMMVSRGQCSQRITVSEGLSAFQPRVLERVYDA